MTTVPTILWDISAGMPSISSEASLNATAATHSFHNDSTVPEPFDIEAVEAWVEKEQARLKVQQIERAIPVIVENNSIRINESAMLYDIVYPVSLSGTTYHVVFTSDGAIEIYEVAP